MLRHTMPKSLGKAKKKQGNRKKCTHCKCKRHDDSKCHMLKQEQEEKVSGLNTSSNALSGKSSGKSLGKSLGKTSKSLFHKGSSSAKITAAESDSNSGSDNTVQVFLA